MSRALGKRIVLLLATVGIALGTAAFSTCASATPSSARLT